MKYFTLQCFMFFLLMYAMCCVSSQKNSSSVDTVHHESKQKYAMCIGFNINDLSQKELSLRDKYAHKFSLQKQDSQGLLALQSSNTNSSVLPVNYTE